MLCIAMSLFVMPAFAETATSGTCGENVTWTLENKTLIISGTGDMESFTHSTTPWRSSRSLITSVIIEDGITSIGSYSFCYFKSLTSITIPDSVVSIYSCAFQYCSNLKDITLPNNVTTIGYGAFRNCTSLTSIIIPNSVTKIDEYAFYSCYNLSNITIPDGVTSIGSCAFSGCSSLADIYLPNSVNVIGHSAFSNCVNLASVTLPDNVTSIDGFAFYNCNALTKITIPSSVTRIGELTFGECTNLTDIEYNGTEEEWNAISVHSNNDYLSNINIHFNNDTKENYTTINNAMITDGILSAEISFGTEANHQKAVVVASFYKDGKAVHINTANFVAEPESNFSVSFDVNHFEYDTCVLMLWDCDGLNSFKPLTQMYCIENAYR